MRIQIENYFLEPETNAPTKYNLFREYITPEINQITGENNKSAGEVKSENLVYGVSLQHAIELIAAHELFDQDKTVTLREYVTEFNNNLKRFDNILKLS